MCLKKYGEKGYSFEKIKLLVCDSISILTMPHVKIEEPSASKVFHSHIFTSFIKVAILD